ncbi:MAG: pseudouridine synthase [Longimicrobiales bacterium]
MRLQKFLSRAGIASRRRAEELIRQGHVRVNGRVITEMGVRIDPHSDRVQVDGRTARLTDPIWIALHKPPGVISSRDDPRGRPTIYALLPAEYAGLFHVGRLDWASEGLLLLTNDGDAANRLLHPRYATPRVYDVVVAGPLHDAALARLRNGVELEDGIARADRIERLPATRPDRSRLRLTLREGRNREVRRMLEAVGHPVRRLVRRQYGPISLRGLGRGEWRQLTAGEVKRLGRRAESER